MRTQLIDDGTRLYLYQKLRDCKEKRVTYYNYIFNLGLFLSLIIIVGFILYYARKYKIKKQNEPDDNEELRIRQRLFKIAHKYQQQRITPFTETSLRAHII